MKKIVFLISCALCFALPLRAEEKKDTTLVIKGKVNGYYKAETNYVTPLDASGHRHGANNRESQTVRTRGELNFLSLSGKQDYNGTDWYQFIGYASVKMDADDPDAEETSPSDLTEPGGKRKNLVYTGDVWARYAPHAAVGIKIGYQTIPATSVAAKTYVYAGDFDDDFQAFHGASTVLEDPGLSIDIHLGKDITLGLGSFDGAGDASAIGAGAASHESKNNVLWFEGKFGSVQLALGQQTISAGGYETSSDDVPIPSQFKHEKTHSILNFSASVEVGMVKPYLGYQSITGDKVQTRFLSGDVSGVGSLIKASVTQSVKAGVKTNLMASGLDSASADAAIASGTFDTTINANVNALVGGLKNFDVTENESETLVGNIISVGAVFDFKTKGLLAIDYTSVSTPGYGETDYVPALVEMDSALMTNYVYPVTNDASITFFYHMLSTKEDSALRKDITTATNNAAVTGALGSSAATATNAYTAYAAGMSKLLWTPTSSVGVQFTINFGG
ncbi:hypothetical protein WDW89_24915 [Deltaproteobacteria bacterium TL4]